MPEKPVSLLEPHSQLTFVAEYEMSMLSLSQLELTHISPPPQQILSASYTYYLTQFGFIVFFLPFFPLIIVPVLIVNFIHIYFY